MPEKDTQNYLTDATAQEWREDVESAVNQTRPKVEQLAERIVSTIGTTDCYLPRDIKQVRETMARAFGHDALFEAECQERGTVLINPDASNGSDHAPCLTSFQVRYGS